MPSRNMPPISLRILIGRPGGCKSGRDCELIGQVRKDLRADGECGAFGGLRLQCTQGSSELQKTRCNRALTQLAQNFGGHRKLDQLCGRKSALAPSEHAGAIEKLRCGRQNPRSGTGEPERTSSV